MFVTGERTCWRAWITFTRKASTAFRPMSSLPEVKIIFIIIVSHINSQILLLKQTALDYSGPIFIWSSWHSSLTGLIQVKIGFRPI